MIPDVLGRTMYHWTSHGMNPTLHEAFQSHNGSKMSHGDHSFRLLLLLLHNGDIYLFLGQTFNDPFKSDLSIDCSISLRTYSKIKGSSRIHIQQRMKRSACLICLFVVNTKTQLNSLHLYLFSISLPLHFVYPKLCIFK